MSRRRNRRRPWAAGGDCLRPQPLEFKDILDYYVFERTSTGTDARQAGPPEADRTATQQSYQVIGCAQFRLAAQRADPALFLQAIQQDFFAARFNQEDHELIVLNGMLCASSNAEFRRKLERLAREFDLLNREDSDKPFDKRHGYTAVLALRDWHYKGLPACARSNQLTRLVSPPATCSRTCRDFARLRCGPRPRQYFSTSRQTRGGIRHGPI